jgi:hypothetical protein
MHPDRDQGCRKCENDGVARLSRVVLLFGHRIDLLRSGDKFGFEE